MTSASTMARTGRGGSPERGFGKWGDRHPLGAAAAFFGMWLAALVALSAAAPLATSALSGAPAAVRLILEVISLVSALVPAIACPLLLGGAAARRRTAAREGLRFGVGLVAGAAWFALVFGALAALSAVDLGSPSNVPALPAWIAACAANAAFQEVLVRGYAFDALARGKGIVFAAVVTTVVFTVFHPGAFACGPVAVLQIAAASVLLTLVRIASGGLAAPIGMHAAWNAVGGIGFGVVSLADDYPSVFDVSLGGPALLSGGAMGVEGGVVALAVTCVLCAAAFAIRPRLRSNCQCG